MRRSVLLGFGFAVVIWGAVLLAQGLSITGFAVLEGIGKGVSSVFGISLLVGGLILLAAARESVSGLERQASAQRETSVLISNIALERMNSDKHVRAMLPRFMKEIAMIKSNPIGRPKEKIGEFLVSPQGHNPVRVAWHYDPKSNTVYIDDVRYHATSKDYDKNWNKRAERGDVTLSSYEASGYSALPEAA